MPDLTLILDCPPEVADMRLDKGRSARDRMELEGTAFMERVREGYLIQARKNPKSCRVIDASQSPEKVAGQALALLEQYVVQGDDQRQG